MVEVAERAERGIDDVAALRARYVDDEADAAGIVLEARVVEAAGSWERAERNRARLGRQRMTGGRGNNAGAAADPSMVGGIRQTLHVITLWVPESYQL